MEPRQATGMNPFDGYARIRQLGTPRSYIGEAITISCRKGLIGIADFSHGVAWLKLIELRAESVVTIG